MVPELSGLSTQEAEPASKTAQERLRFVIKVRALIAVDREVELDRAAQGSAPALAASQTAALPTLQHELP